MLEAAQWIEGAFFQATLIISVIAVAGYGLLLLSGRINLRRAAQIVVGCALMTFAGTIAAALIPGANPRSQSTADLAKPAVPQRAEPTSSFDPYAGASAPGGSGQLKDPFS
jgi:hypothetical protein